MRSPAPSFSADGIAVLCLGEHLRAHRIAHHDGLIGCSQLFHSSGHSGEHEIHIRCQQLVGHAREGVLLMNGGVDAHFGGTAHHRAGHIAAAADDQVRLDLLHDGFLALGPERARFHSVTIFRLMLFSDSLRWKPVISIWWKG